MIKREQYLKEIRKFMDKPVIKVITGMRRSGKSMILNLISKELEENGVNKENIIFINFESLMFSELTNFKNLYSYIIDKSQNITGKIYILLDEIQEVDSWEKAINSLLVDLNCDIYITGSNANLLSSELATYIAGRYVEIKVFPLSFKEFIKFSKIQNPQKIYTTEEYFKQYLKFGGLPAIHNFSQDKTSIYQYLTDIYNSVLLKDVISKNNIRDIELLERVILFIFDNIGKLKTKEIDFIGQKENEKLYIQVTYLLASDDTVEREFAPLKDIKDNYPKYVLSMDNLTKFNINGIERKKIIDFLLEQ